MMNDDEAIEVLEKLIEYATFFLTKEETEAIEKGMEALKERSK